jgi:hypothetical protein
MRPRSQPRREASRAEQRERSLTDRYGPFVTMLDREPKAGCSEERVDESSGSVWHLRLALH